jgi:hypothetical protein
VYRNLNRLLKIPIIAAAQVDAVSFFAAQVKNALAVLAMTFSGAGK